ncbi:tetratricopeptide repeat protein [Reinekea sp.]|jgi:tetratricopeptide (TPR) repeat protein|uniref:tetratricopeptide repeat protein n=1 Tax=Reinekea sp. TaxID=1970455 RepID=UPI00398998DD
MYFKNIGILFALTLTLVLSACNSENATEKADGFIKRSIAYEKQGQYRATLIEIRNAIQAEPENLDHIQRYAEVLIKIGSVLQAESLLVSVNNRTEALNLLLANALLKQGKYISAAAILGQLPATVADQTSKEHLEALVAYFSGDQATAFNSFRALAGQQDTPVDVVYEFINLLIQNRQFAEAKQWSDQILASNPNDANALYYSAKLAYESNQLTAAESLLTKALIQLRETDVLLQERVQVLELLSTTLTALGRSTEAFVYQKIIREANPEAFAAQQQYKDALAAASQGDLAAAKTAFEDILTQFPNNQQAALLLGLIHLEEGDTATAEGLLSENLDAETAPVSLIRATALAQSEQGKSEEALAVLERALLVRPDDSTLLALFGIISINSGEERQGLASVSKALQLEPDRTRLHLLLAQYYVDQDQTDLALGHLRQAYAKNPKDWSTSGYYLATLLESREQAEAVSVRDSLYQQFPNDPASLWLVAMTDYKMGKLDNAKSNLKALLAIDSKNLNALNALAGMYQQSNEYDMAADFWLKALQVNPGNPSYLQSLVQNKARTHSFAELTAWISKQANTHKDIALPLNSVLVELYVNSKNMDQAQAIADQYKNTDQPYARGMQANLLRGHALLAAEKQEWTAAVGHLDEALKILPNDTKLTLLAAQFEFSNSQGDLALTRIDELLKLNERNYPAVIVKTQIIEKLENLSQAFGYIDDLWQAQPHGAILNAYLYYLKKEQPNNVERELKRLVAMEPNNDKAHVLIADSYLSQGKHVEAIASYELALVSNPQSIPALNNLAWLLKENKVDRALDYATKAAQLAPNSANVLDTLAWVLHLQGNKQQALDAINKALTLEPDNTELQQHKAQILGK